MKRSYRHDHPPAKRTPTMTTQTAKPTALDSFIAKAGEFDVSVN